MDARKYFWYKEGNKQHIQTKTSRQCNIYIYIQYICFFACFWHWYSTYNLFFFKYDIVLPIRLTHYTISCQAFVLHCFTQQSNHLNIECCSLSFQLLNLILCSWMFCMTSTTPHIVMAFPYIFSYWKLEKVWWLKITDYRWCDADENKLAKQS